MSYRLPLWATAAITAGAVLITFNLTYIFAERKFQQKLDSLSDAADTSALTDDSTITASSGMNELSAEGIGAYITASDSVYSVDGLIEGGIAARSGVCAGDIITAIDGNAVTDELISSLSGGESLTLSRGGAELVITLSADDSLSGENGG